MKIDRLERAKRFAHYMLTTSGTIRATGKQFSYSKSQVHKDLRMLEKEDAALYSKVRELLNKNKEERTARGGRSTQMLWREKKCLM